MPSRCPSIFLFQSPPPVPRDLPSPFHGPAAPYPLRHTFPFDFFPQICVFDGVAQSRRFSQFGLSAPRGLLLYGPPGDPIFKHPPLTPGLGCGKTSLAWGLRRAMKGVANFVYGDAAELLGSVVGESERKIRALWEEARGARPALLFIDQVLPLCRGQYLPNTVLQDRGSDSPSGQ